MKIAPCLLLVGFEIFFTHGCLVGTPPPTPAPPTSAPPSNGGTCRCGQSSLGRRIVGGTAATISEVPWQVALTTATTVPGGQLSVFCGGTLLNANFVLTAAHCTQPFGHQAGRFRVVIGMVRRTGQINNNNLFPVSAVTRHPSYNGNVQNGFDMSVLRLGRTVSFTQFPQIFAVCWPSRSEQIGQTSVTSGWGTLSSGGSQPDTLQRVNVPVLANNNCGRNTGLTNTMVCAGETGKDSCQGDSGGPLVQQNGNRWELIGVTSFGFGCALAGFPGVYADVPFLRTWVAGIAGSECTRA